jgi:hypothetical protein
MFPANRGTAFAIFYIMKTIDNQQKSKVLFYTLFISYLIVLVIATFFV